MEVHALKERGWTITAIANHLGHDRKTIRDYLKGERTPGVRMRVRASPTKWGAITWAPHTVTTGAPRGGVDNVGRTDLLHDRLSCETHSDVRGDESRCGSTTTVTVHREGAKVATREDRWICASPRRVIS